MNMSKIVLGLVVCALACTAVAAGDLEGVQNAGEPRLLPGFEANPAAIAKVVTASYGDVVSALAPTEDPETKRRTATRLGLALYMFNQGLHDIGPIDSNSPENKAASFGPSPESLARIESMLPNVERSDGMDAHQYLHVLQPKLATLGYPGYRQLMGEVANEASRNRTVFGANVTPKFDGEGWARVRDIVGDTTTRTGYRPPKYTTSDVDIPDTPPIENLAVDHESLVIPFSDTLPETPATALTADMIVGMTRQQMADMLAALDGVSSQIARQNFALLEQSLPAEDEPEVEDLSEDGPTTQTDNRTTELTGGSKLPGWYKDLTSNTIALATLADFVPTSDGENATSDDDVETDGIETPFDEFVNELRVRDTEGTFQRLGGNGE